MTSLAISEKHLEIIHDLIRLHAAASLRTFTESMVLYFKETGINPLSRDKSTSEELAKLRNTIISFIREQEKTKLLPLIEQVNEISLTIVHYFNEDAVRKSDLETLLQF